MAKLRLSHVSLATLLVGCSSAGAGPTNAGTTPGDAGVTVTSPTISVSGFVQSDGMLLPGASVCLQGSSNCTKSGNGFPAGYFVLSGVPANHASLTFRKDGFLPSLRPMLTRTGDIILPAGENTMFPATSQTFMGTAMDPSKGHIAFFVTSPSGQPASGVSVTISAGSAGDGATHRRSTLNADGSPAADATAGSRGGFLNLPRGLYVLHFGLAYTTCLSSDPNGPPMTASTGEALVLVPVVAGYVTTPVSVLCVGW